MSLYAVDSFSRSRDSTPLSSSSSTRLLSESSTHPKYNSQPHSLRSALLGLPPLHEVLRENGIGSVWDSGQRGIPDDREGAASLSHTSTYRLEAPPSSPGYPSYHYQRAYAPPNYAPYLTDSSRHYTSDRASSFAGARSSSDSLDRPASSPFSSDDGCWRRNSSDHKSISPDAQRSRSYSDPRLHSPTTSSLGKRAHTERDREQNSPIVHRDSDVEKPRKDAPYKENCTVHRVEEFDQGPGEEPLKVFFNCKGVKLEIVKIEVEVDNKKYLEYAEPVPSDPSRWRCTCIRMENGKPVKCSYSSKKHLVKRHIETTHLNIKRFQCSWCGSAFTQRSNAENCHINTHSGESPHACPHCDSRFKDPSKLYKHLSRAHSEEVSLKRRRCEVARDFSQDDLGPGMA